MARKAINYRKTAKNFTVTGCTFYNKSFFSKWGRSGQLNAMDTFNIALVLFRGNEILPKVSETFFKSQGKHWTYETLKVMGYTPWGLAPNIF